MTSSALEGLPWRDDHSTAQIGSGFGAQSTAAEVLDGIDLSGKLAIVTGGYSGIGIETTRALVARARSVVVPARRPDHAREELAGIEGVEVDELQLDDLDSVRAFAERFDSAALDLLINNAGVMASPAVPRRPGLGGPVRDQPPRPLRADEPPLAGVRTAGRARRRAHLGRAPVSGIRWDDLQFERDPTTSGRPTASRRPPTACSRCSSTRSARTRACARSRCTRAAS